MTKPRLCSRRCCGSIARYTDSHGDPVCFDHFNDAEDSADLFDDDAAEREREAFMRLARAN